MITRAAAASVLIALCALSAPAENLPAKEFAPLSYADAADAAIACSDDLRVELSRLSLREGTWLWGIRAFFPSVSISFGEDDRLSLAGSDSFSKTACVSAEQLLWDGGRTGVSRDLESAELRLARAAIERKTRETAESAIAAYRSVLSVRALRQIKKASAESLAEQRRILAMEVSAGLARADDLAEAEIRVEEAELDASSTAMDVEAAEDALAEAIGRETLPPLSERIDVEKRAVALGEGLVSAIADAAKCTNGDVETSRLSIEKKRAQAKQAAAAWAPAIKLNAALVLSGDRLPLTRTTWSAGLSFEFSGPLLNGSTSATAGWEPPYDKTAGVSLKATPLPDPGAALSGKAAEAELGFEIAKHARLLCAVDREVQRAVERYGLLDRKVGAALSSRELAQRRVKLGELSAEMGRATRIELMETRLECAKAEARLVEAAVALIEGERALERLMDAPPGTLAERAGRAGRE